MKDVDSSKVKQVNWTIPDWVVRISMKNTKSKRLIVLYCMFCMASC